ncbi:ABC transporter [Kocuria dechangensis]|uniref:ABC transporter n=1 Tax=Kocuria dechangensis TaxID=1176249 RepID=A0A917LW51_9MICC|nr:metal ABC transporter permease [Kocuria dechangensis]GGG62481.1 ABC transporter [Kocuria dechangensis]
MSLLDPVTTMLASPLMQRGLIAALLIGLAAPVMGTYLVQRRMALLGDGIGHMALTGVAMGWLAGAAAGPASPDALAVPGAIVAAVAGAVLIELVRTRGKTSGDVALALLFYGGIAGGVLLIGVAGGTSANLTGYLFGSISTVTAADVWLTAGLSAVVLGVGIGLRHALFALCHDEESARAAGLPVHALNLLVAVVAALTVSVSMRVVGVLLVSAVMVVPVATAQLLTRSFAGTMGVAMGLGALVCVAGLSITWFHALSPGATIVVLAIGVYALVAVAAPVLSALPARRGGPPGDVRGGRVPVRSEA